MRMHEPSRTPEQRPEPIWDELAMPQDSGEPKDPVAAEFGRRGGLKGGRARADKLSPEQRTEAARKAAEARWSAKGRVVKFARPELARGDREAMMAAAADSLRAVMGEQPFGTIVADPPWRFTNRTGKVAPEHRRLARYDTMSIAEICSLPVREVAAAKSHCYLWTPNALVPDALEVLSAWGFTYKTMFIWHKVRKDGGSDGRGVGFYFRNVTETVLFGVRGSLRTFQPGRRQVNLLATRKREHSRKPDEMYGIVEACSPGPFLELFARYPKPGWSVWGDEAAPDITPRGRQHRGYGVGR
jgi:N6-adenosine-specific RNA methylase IME4